MRFNHRSSQRSLSLTLPLISLILQSACSQPLGISLGALSPGTEGNTAGTDSGNGTTPGTVTNGGTTTTGTSTNPNSNVPPVCNPGIGSGNSGLATTNGLSGWLDYLPSNSTLFSNAETITLSAFAAGSTYAIFPPAFQNIYFNDLDVPTTLFTNGFHDGKGNPLVDNNGNLLIQYFAIHFDSQIMLSSSDPVGNYQFALLSDDGSNMYITPPGQSQSQLIANDGEHASLVKCASTTVAMSKGSPLPIHVDYFQGPPNSIALMLLWRLNPTTLNDSSCNQTGGDGYYFNENTEAPLGGWNSLQSSGWSVVPAADFYLQNNQTNPCNTSSSG